MARRERNAPIWIKILVWVHVIVISIKCLPPAPADAIGPAAKRQLFGSEYILYYNGKLKPFLEPYLWATGVWQSWDMFAPNPSDWEGYVTATITYKDGTVREYVFPRMYELGLGLKYFKERYRKFLERAHHDSHSWIRERFALRIAAKNYTDEANPPAKVELHRHVSIVPPTLTFGAYLRNLGTAIGNGNLSMKVLMPDNPKMPPYTDNAYYTLVVKERDLRELTGS